MKLESERKLLDVHNLEKVKYIQTLLSEMELAGFNSDKLSELKMKASSLFKVNA